MRNYCYTIFLLVFALLSCENSLDNIWVKSDIDQGETVSNAYHKSFNRRAKGTTEKQYLITPEMADIFVAIRFPDKSVLEATALEDEGSLLYLYSFNKGWALISSDTRAQAVIAYDEEGEMTAEMLRSVPLVGWYELACEEQRALKRLNPNIENEHTALWDKLSSETQYFLPGNNNLIPTKGPIPDEEHYVWGKLLVSRVLWCTDTISNIGHLIETKWGQSHPWDVSMPVINGTDTHLLTGCVAVALSQLMYYHHFKNGKPDFFYSDIAIDSTIYNTEYHPYTYASTTINRGLPSASDSFWNSMALDSTSTGNPHRFKYVSDLMLDFGGLLNMKYIYMLSMPYISGVPSDSTLTKVSYALNDYGFHYSDIFYSPPIVLSELMAQRPIFIYDRPSAQENGHAWLIDGYKEFSNCYILTYVWTKIYNQTLWEECYEIDTEPTSVHQEGDEDFEYEYTSEKYLKMNWGWDGLYDDIFVTIGSSGSWSANNYQSRWCNLIYSIYPHFLP